MVSSVLAQAILNQRAPDIVGEFQRGSETGRSIRGRELAGRALQGQQGAFTELQGVDPQLALQIGSQMRANTAADIEETLRDMRFTQSLLGAGSIDQAGAFLRDRQQRLLSQGRDTTQTDQVLELVNTAPNEAYAGLQKFFGVWDGAKRANRVQSSQILTDGTTIQVLSDGSTRVTDPQGAELTGQARADAIRNAREAGIEEQAGRAGARTQATLRERIEQEPTLEERRTTARSEAEQRQDLRKTVFTEARSANQTLSEARRLRTALENVRTGRIAAARQAVGGLIPGARDADAETLNSAINEFVLRRKDELLGGGILSDADIALLQTIGPQLGNTVEANLNILSRFEQYANNAVDRARRLRDFKGDVLNFDIESLDAGSQVGAPPPATEDAGTGGNVVNWSDL